MILAFPLLRHHRNTPTSNSVHPDASSLPYSTHEFVRTLLTCQDSNILDLTISAGHLEQNIISSTLPSTPTTRHNITRGCSGLWLIGAFVLLENRVRSAWKLSLFKCQKSGVTRAHPPRTPHLLCVFSLTFCPLCAFQDLRRTTLTLTNHRHDGWIRPSSASTEQRV